MALVEYLVARDGPPPRQGLAYDYVLGGDGLYLVADNAHLDVRVPVARCAVRGLPPLYAACTLKHGPLPAALWAEIVERIQVWAPTGHELLLTVGYDEAHGYQLAVPLQLVTRANVFYRPPTEAVLEIHSHHGYAACFSATDDADEQRLCLYGVVGRLGAERPEVALRVGVYGYFMSLPWEAVFVGDRGAFRDANFDPCEDTGGADGLSD